MVNVKKNLNQIDTSLKKWPIGKQLVFFQIKIVLVFSDKNLFDRILIDIIMKTVCAFAHLLTKC